MRKSIVIDQQSYLDLAIVQYGSVEGIFKLFEDDKRIMQFNSFVDPAGFTIETPLGLLTNLIPGQEVISTSPVINQDVFNYYKEKGIKSITSFYFDQTEAEDNQIPDHNQFDFNNSDYH